MSLRSRLFTGAALVAVANLSIAGAIEMKVNGLVCAFCAQGIEKKFRKNPAIADVFVSLETRLVAIRTKEGEDIADAVLRKSLTDAGYDVKEIQRTENSLASLREKARGSRK